MINTALPWSRLTIISLTLTNANRVHIVEPHWNPALEAQAIARVLRMGQTQTVTIVKYITEGTVEQVTLHTNQQFKFLIATQNIVKLQEKKSRIAKVSLDSTSNGDATGLLDVCIHCDVATHTNAT